jgi:hypothetical protein
LQQRHVVPVLFVHGHLGTHQQMRSAASETGRELARRLASNASWPLWLQWYGTDFAAEASALDGALLVRHCCCWLATCRRALLAHACSPARLVPFCRINRLPLWFSALSTCTACTAALLTGSVPSG